MTEHVKNQHFVPQFLLRYFSKEKPGHVWGYDKKLNDIRERSIRSIAKEDYFYDLIPGSPESSLDPKIGIAETDAAPVIEKIIESQSLETLTPADIASVAILIALQLNRTKTAFNKVQDFSQQLSSFIQPFAKYHKVEVDVVNTRGVWLSTIEDVEIYAKILIKKNWFLLCSDEKFYTSDHPVVKQNSSNNNPYRGTLGLNSDGIEIYFPLTPSLALCLFCERTATIPPNMKFICKPENIENMNSLQFLYADRFIFSATNDFDLAVDMNKNK